jgi:hypothetical protein
VIPFRSPLWTFLDFVDGGKNVIQEWYDKLSPEAQFSFDAVLKNHRKVESISNWTGFKFLKGKPQEEKSGSWIFSPINASIGSSGYLAKVQREPP